MIVGSELKAGATDRGDLEADDSSSARAATAAFEIARHTVMELDSTLG